MHSLRYLRYNFRILLLAHSSSIIIKPRCINNLNVSHACPLELLFLNYFFTGKIVVSHREYLWSSQCVA